MPRSNRPRRRGRQQPEQSDQVDLSRALFGTLRTETKRGRLWNVQPVSGASSVKSYLCPGCGLDIAPGTPHLVSWRADGLLGPEDDLADRRHWHSHCWKVG